jgi:hypothetical protein
MSATAAKLDRQATDSSIWNVWADIEARLNEIGAGGEQVDRLAQAVRFVWGNPNSPKHD